MKFDPKHVKKLKRFKQRNFAWGKGPDEDGRVAHHMACDIYRSKECYGFATCTCGLLHDLLWLGGCVDPVKLYPKFQYDYKYQEMSWERQQEWDAKPCDEKIKDFQRTKNMMDMVFGSETVADIAAQDQLDAYEWDLIKHVFGPNFRKNTERIYGSPPTYPFVY